MANITDTYCEKHSDHTLNYALQNHLIYKVFPGDVSHAFTLRLVPPMHDLDPELWNINSQPQRNGLIKGIIRRIDKQIYGRSYPSIPRENKFNFLLLEETRDKVGIATFAHIHGVFAFNEFELAKFNKKKSKIEQKISQMTGDRGLIPDIKFQTADRGIIRYMTKNAMVDAASINTRATI